MSDTTPPADGGPAPAAIDPRTPHSARVWNYWLGGKDNYPADRAAGDDVLATVPDIAIGARAERAFLIRAVRHLVQEAGIRQFLDIGTGLPTMNNTHEVAQSLAPESRVVYVDNDPLVMAHAAALLSGADSGATDYIEADLRSPGEILDRSRATLDFDRPIGLMLLGVVNHIVDDAEAHAAVSRLISALPPGSHVVLTHSTAEVHGQPMLDVMREMNERGGTPIRARTRTEIEEFFAGTELLDPGVVSCSLWRPDPAEVGIDQEVYLFGGVSRVL
ncbi:SAM-dependent methyltransferase [Nocardiopsis coralliicola]